MKMLAAKTGILGIGALATAFAIGAGYEKNVTWSGQYVGIAGSAASSVQGPESLYFNPAGLAGSEGWQLSANFSPTWPKFNGPVIQNNANNEGNRVFLPVFGLTASYGISPKLSAGIGYYAVGGAEAAYDGIDPTNFGSANAFDQIGPQTVKTDLKIMELALGASYKLDSHWSFGAAWRASFVKAGFSIFSPRPLNPAAAALYLNLYDLTDVEWLAVRLGLQYRGDDNKWGLGLAWRSPVTFTAGGKVNGKADAPTFTGGNIAETNATVKNTFPMQLILSGDFSISDQWRLFSEYNWIKYSNNQQIDLTGTVTLPAGLGGTPINLASSPIPQHWYDQHNLRLAFEYTGWNNWPLRFGYVFTSQVVPKSTAIASLPAPGIGNTLTIGSGHTIGNVALNAAFEYSFEKATVAASDGGIQGDYKVDAYALHLGATYKF